MNSPKPLINGSQGFKRLKRTMSQSPPIWKIQQPDRGMQRKYKTKRGRVCFKSISAWFENREVPKSVTSTLDKCRFLCGQVSIDTCV